MTGMIPMNLNPSGPQGLVAPQQAAPQQVAPQQVAPQQSQSGGKGLSALAGMGMAAAFGANPLAGLLVAAPLFQHARETARRGNEDRRYRLDQRQAQSAAQQELSGMLAGGTPEQRMGGLLLQGYPNTAPQVAGRLFGQQERAAPSDIRTLQELGMEPTLDNLQRLYDIKSRGDGSLERIMAEVQLMREQRALADENRAAEQAARDAERKERAAVRNINSGLGGLSKWAKLNEELAPTILSSGATADTMRSFVSGRQFAKSVLGLDAAKDTEMLTKFDTFYKLSNDILLDVIPSLEGINANTDQRLQQIRDSLGGIGVQPGANSVIAAQNMNELLNIAIDNGYRVDNIDEIRSVIRKLESGQSLLDKPKAEPTSDISVEEAMQDEKYIQEALKRGLAVFTGNE